jgi:hypothetical protein
VSITLVHEFQESVNRVLTSDEYFAGNFPKELGKNIQILWNETGIQSAYEQASKFQLLDSAK